MLPSVSVLLPVHNAAATLGRAIGTIREQTFREWELLVVDDGSTDASTEIALMASQGDDRIRVLTQPHGGIVAALNHGVAIARGIYLARMDADDESWPERLEEQRTFLNRHPEIGLVGCLVEFGGDRSTNLGYAMHVDWINSLVTPEAIALNRFVESPFAHPSVMMRRDLLDQHGPYREGDFPEDYELWLRCLDAGVKMAKVPRVLLRWNDPPNRLSRRDGRYAPERFFRLKASWIGRELRRRGLARGVWIWGAGRPTRKRAAHLADAGVSPAGYIDIDPKKIGRRVNGLPVVAPSDIPPPADAFVLGYVSSRGARDLIRSALTARAYEEGRDFLMCA